MVEVSVGGASRIDPVDSPDRLRGDPVGVIDKRLRGALVSMRERIDYAEYGGAPLLGVKGVTIIAHGRSDARAISSAVRFAKRMVEADINRHITEEIHALAERS